jgi:hypothetical protein
MELTGIELAGWRTSSYSDNGGNTCVEVGSAPWRTSSYSGNGGNTCVQAAAIGRVIAVRDTTDRGAGLTLAFSAAAWSAFTASLK